MFADWLKSANVHNMNDHSWFIEKYNKAVVQVQYMKLDEIICQLSFFSPEAFLQHSKVYFYFFFHKWSRFNKVINFRQ